MPAAVKYFGPNDPQRTGLMLLGRSERTERATAFELAETYYKGLHKPQLDIKEGEPDDNIVVNVFQTAVDRTLSFLFPALPRWQTDPTVTVENENERWIREVWENSGGLELLYNIGYNGALSGHCWIKLLPKEDGDLYPTIYPLDPTTITAYWDYRDLRKVLWFEFFYSASVTDPNVAINGNINQFKDYLQDIVWNPDSKNWTIIDFERPATLISDMNAGGQWTETARDTWNYTFPPIISWKHQPNPNRFYGKSEAINLELNDKLNLIASETARIIRYYAAPRTILAGVSPGDVSETAIDGAFAVPKDAQVYNLEMKSDLQSSQKMVDFLHDAMLAQSRVVLLKGSIKDFQRVTNVAIRSLFLDMILKNNLLRSIYGNAVRKASRYLFIIGGKGDINPTIIWPDPLPIDDTEVVAVEKVERDMGIVSRQTISQKRGYNWNDEIAKQQAESKLPIFNPVQTQKTDQMSGASQDNASNVKQTPNADPNTTN